jgi:hypothetical protein
MQEKVQPPDKYKSENTPEKENAKLEAIMRCALYESGLGSDLTLANGVLGQAYVNRRGQTTTTIDASQTTVGPVDPDADKYTGCMGIYMDNARSNYGSSLSDDLTQIEVFTAAMIDEIGKSINASIILDKTKAE